MFGNIKGNPRAGLLYEPLFLLPSSLFMPYASVYMLQLGASASEIGWITTLGLVLQIFTSMISGYITDRLGRRMTLLVFDLISWSAATLIWALADNIWYFVAAAVLNSFIRVASTAWRCLLVEDTPPQDRYYVFGLLQLIGVVCGLFAPLGGLMVGQWSVVPAVRLMYAISFACITVMCIARHLSIYETEIGLRKKNEYSKMRISSMWAEYKTVTRMIATNRQMMLVFSLYILFQFQITVKNTFLSVYIVEWLRFPDAFVAIFPAITSAAMLALILFVSHRIKASRLVPAMIAGFILSAAAVFIQIAIPAGEYAWLIASGVLSAIGTIMTAPYLEAAVANAIDDDKRAGMLSILSVIMLVFISPAGAIGGWSYTLDPRLPFLLMAVTFVASAIMIYYYKPVEAAPAG